MRMTVLGCSGAEMPGHYPPAFLLDDEILLDAGTVTSVLDEKAQQRIRHIFVTHAHLDHIRSIPSLADNLSLNGERPPVPIHGIPPVLEAIRDHLLNNLIWPDFTGMRDDEGAILTYDPITPGVWKKVDDFEVMGVPVSHSIPAAGFLFRRNGACLLYTGDTGPTYEIWRASETVSAILTEVSFPNRMAEMAEKTGHLSPDLLERQLHNMKTVPKQILITHLKPRYSVEIRAEIEQMDMGPVRILKEGDVVEV